MWSCGNMPISNEPLPAKEVVHLLSFDESFFEDVHIGVLLDDIDLAAIGK
jgi:hypothetical protein